MHNGELAKIPSFTLNTKRMSKETGCDALVKQMFRIGWKHCCIVGL